MSSCSYYGRLEMTEAPVTNASDYAVDVCFEQILKRNNELIRKESSKLLGNFEKIHKEKLNLLDEKIKRYEEKLRGLAQEWERIMSKRCDTCQGVGKTLGIGGMIKECNACSGKGYVKEEEVKPKKEAEKAKKSGKKSRKVS